MTGYSDQQMFRRMKLLLKLKLKLCCSYMYGNTVMVLKYTIVHHIPNFSGEESGCPKLGI